MTENDNESSTQVRHRILNAAQGVLVHDVARSADDKKIADIRVENDFGSGARIGAGKNDSEWVLGFLGFFALGRNRFSLRDVVAGKAGVAFFEFSERVIRA